MCKHGSTWLNICVCEGVGLAVSLLSQERQGGVTQQEENRAVPKWQGWCSLLDNVVLSVKAATQRSVCPHAGAGGHEATG